MPSDRFAAYKTALAALSARTKTPLPSLILSFGILHELTALAPLAGVFYASRTLGVGERVVQAVIQSSSGSDAQEQRAAAPAWAIGTLRTWVEEGDRWAAKLGRRYGIFGYEKRVPGSVDELREEVMPAGHIAGDVANAVVAYAATKALMPVRIGASLYLSPAFSRRIVEPVRKAIIRPFRRDS